MAMTARERLGEYATLKALGFGPPFVARLVLAESLVLGALGGLLAIVVTGPVARGFFQSVGKQVFAVFEVAPITYLWQALAALAVGLLAALVPMLRSARVGIVEGLRHVG
jgi:putative ABC transport system permease protein